MYIDPRDQRVRDLCERLSKTTDEEELQDLAAELHVALHEHLQFVRLLTFKTVKRFPKNDSDSKAAD